MMIRSKLRAILVVLFAFIVGLVALNFYTFEQLDGDASAVNASGSLRMRAYRLAWLSARLVPADAEQAEDIHRKMEEQMTEYDRILAGLEYGDEELRLLPAEEPAVLAQIAVVKPLWAAYRADVETAQHAADHAAKQAANDRVEATVGAYVAEVDKLVMAYDHASERKIAVSKQIELIVIVLAFLIFVGSSYLIITQVLRPLGALTRSFREVAGKEADLTQQLSADRYDEIGRIVHSFNSFVSDLHHIVKRAQMCATEVSGLSDTLWQASLENSKAVEYNAIAVTNVAGNTNEQNNEIQMLATSITGIASHVEELQRRAQAADVDRTALLTSIEAVRACTQVAAAASDDVAKTAQEIAGLTQDSAAAIEQQTASLEAFAATAEHLRGLAAELDSLVGRFKV